MIWTQSLYSYTLYGIEKQCYKRTKKKQIDKKTFAKEAHCKVKLFRSSNHWKNPKTSDTVQKKYIEIIYLWSAHMEEENTKRLKNNTFFFCNIWKYLTTWFCVLHILTHVTFRFGLYIFHLTSNLFSFLSSLLFRFSSSIEYDYYNKIYVLVECQVKQKWRKTTAELNEIGLQFLKSFVESTKKKLIKIMFKLSDSVCVLL